MGLGEAIEMAESNICKMNNVHILVETASEYSGADGHFLDAECGVFQL